MYFRLSNHLFSILASSHPFPILIYNHLIPFFFKEHIMSTQREIQGRGPLLRPDGSLADLGWARQPLLDCNLEATRVYDTFRFLQPLRLKRWDYYGITTPTHFYSFTISDIGYLGMVFIYVIEFASGHYVEKTLAVPLARGVQLPRGSEEGESLYDNGQVRLRFWNEAGCKRLEVNWPGFDEGPLRAEASFALPPEHESMVIVIPIKGKRFYYNRKVNCMPASGWVEQRGQRETLDPATCLGNLDWGRGVWEYKSFWVWASASGFLPDRRRVGLNLGFGFGDTSAATENALILDGRIHKLGQVDFTYDNQHFKNPWHMRSSDGRLDLTFTPFFERVAATNAVILTSEVHQMFGHYSGTVVTDQGETLHIENLVGFAEEHHAKW